MIKKIKYFMLMGLVFFGGILSAYAGYEQDANTRPPAGSGIGCDGESSCWKYTNINAPLFAVRLTVVDANGDKIAGTKSIDLMSSNYKLSSTFRGTKVYYNKNRSHKKNATNPNWIAGKPTTTPFKGAEYSKGKTIEFVKDSNNNNLNRTPSDYFNTIAKKTFKSKNIDELMKTEFYQYLKMTGYDITKYNVTNPNSCHINADGNRECDTVYKSHYVTIEPISLITIGSSSFYGTGSELAMVIKKLGDVADYVSTVPGILSQLLFYEGKFTPPLWYTKANVNKSQGEITKAIQKNLKTGYSLGVYWMGGAIPDNIINTCDFNNPSDFYKLDKDGDEVINTDTNCCSLAASQLGLTQAQINERYPMCNQCKPKTTVNNASCLQDVTNTTISDDTLDCVSRVGKKDKKNYIKKVNNYCEIYCREDINIDFPLSPMKSVPNITAGGTFTWPSYNIDTNSSVATGSRQCKMRVKAAEWQWDYNNATAAKKSELIKQMNTCGNPNTLSKYAYDFAPEMTLTYDPGSKTGNLTFTLDKLVPESKKATSNCVNCSSRGTFNGSNVENWKTSIEQQQLNSTVTYQYVLPKNLNQFYSKIYGDSENSVILTYKPGQSVNKTSSSLKVSEKAKPNEKYDIKIDPTKLSGTKGSENRFDSSVNAYSCKYEVGKTVIPQCDINEPSHFLDINNNGTSGDDNSGPNGENCCMEIYKQYGPDSEQYALIKDKCGTPTSSCVYPRDIEPNADYVTRKRCCAEISKSNDSVDVAFYKKYCTDEPYCPQDCDEGVCHESPMTIELRKCMDSGKSYAECKADNCPGGGNVVIYRPISLLANEAFPGVENDNRINSNKNWYYYSNWAYRGGRADEKAKKVDMYITNNRGYKEYDIYNREPMYVINLDANDIMSIRRYNKTHSYDNFELECKNGRQCRSTWIKQYVSPTSCGIKGWYDCPGVSAKRGD